MNFLQRPNIRPLHSTQPRLPLYRDYLKVYRPAQTHRSPFVLVCILLAMGLATIAMMFAPWQQTSSGVGRVIAYNPLERQQRLEAPIKGRILRWYATEGSVVKKGQLIAEMTDVAPRALALIYQQREAITEQLRFAKQQAKAYTNKIDSLKRVQRLHRRANKLKIRVAQQKLKATRQKFKAVAFALKTAQLNLQRSKKLLADSIISRRKYEVAQMKEGKLRMEKKIARASILASKSKVVEARAQAMKKNAEDQSKIDSARAEYEKARDKVAAAQSKLAQMNLKADRQASQKVYAPRDAVLLRLLVREGSEMLKAGSPIAVLVPRTKQFAVELWIDGNDIPLIRKGRSVRLQFEGWPAIQFSGWPSVAVGTFGGRVALVDATNNKSGKFRIVIQPNPKDAPWPKAPYLRQGAKTKGWVLLDRVRLGYEFWRQLNGFPATVTPDTAPKSKDSVFKNSLKKSKNM